MFRLFRKASLKILLFHSLFLNSAEVGKEFIDTPVKKAVTLENFRKFIDKSLKESYIFISPDELFKKNWKLGKYILITFDDGYYNNYHALEILREYNVPAIFFISTANVFEQKSFWWDVLFRERKRAGVSREKIAEERQDLKKKNHEEIEKYIISAFGAEALRPKNDIERPFTSDELRDFGRNKLVYFGNHTRHHTILTNYSHEDIRNEILGAEEDLRGIGVAPLKILAYPNGSVSNEVIGTAREIGIELGMTAREKNNKLPLNDKTKYILGRFSF